MEVSLFRGPGRVFGFSKDPSGSNLPAGYAPWSHFKTVEMHPGQPMPGGDVDECLQDLQEFVVHITDAHLRITEQALRTAAGQ